MESEMESACFDNKKSCNPRHTRTVERISANPNSSCINPFILQTHNSKANYSGQQM